MKKTVWVLAFIGTCVSLTACTTGSSFRTAAAQSYQAEGGAGETLSGPVGGALVGSMDSIDKDKLSHALDNPLGKSTHWVNQSTGISYTVVPTAKVTVGDNNFCRKYTVSASQGDRQQTVNGTACVEAATGTWKAV